MPESSRKQSVRYAESGARGLIVAHGTRSRRCYLSADRAAAPAVYSNFA